MDTPQRDNIANFLLQYYIEGNEYLRPEQLQTIPSLDNLARTNLDRRHVERQAYQESAISLGATLLVSVLQIKSIDSISEKEISLKLEAVYKGKSQTLRPLLDFLIEGGFFPDPDGRVNKIVAGIPSKMADAECAWQQDYEGIAHETLLQNIQSSFEPAPYRNVGWVVQSSGYGKSRTVDEMATFIPTIPMNVRAVEEEREGAFPPADTTLIEMFDAMIKVDDPVLSLLFFFKLLFDYVRNLAKAFQGTFTQALYCYLKDRNKRAKLYTDLLEKMKPQSQESENSLTRGAIDSFMELAKLFPENKGAVQMVIYIDEAHTLAARVKAGVSMYDHMLKAIAELAPIGVFFLFISTSSRLEVLIRQSTLPTSARLRALHSTLIAPFTEMPFDCHPSLVQKPIQSGLELAEIQKFSFAVQFGRPLFWAYFKTMLERGENEYTAHISVIAMAQAKLIAKLDLSMPTTTGKLAILDTLLNLEYDPRKTHNDKLASKMVASHLRTVYSVPDSHAYMHTGFPSEPVLAEAALAFAIEMSPNTLGPLLPLYKDVNANITGAIHKGERGENVAKMILLLAYAAAVKKHRNSLGRQFWGHGCSLVHFFEELTGEKFITTVLTSVPGNVQGGAEFQEAFKDSWVRFTHFARATDDAAMTTSMAWVAFIRGMAMIGCPSQKFVDLCIPVLIDKNKPIGEANITTILVQLRVRAQATPRTRVSIHEQHIKCFPPAESSRDAFAKPDASENKKHAYHTRPYISLVMELGLVATLNSASIPSNIVDFLDQNRSQDPAPISPSKHHSNFSVYNAHIAPPPAPWDKHILPVHPRYSLFYYGCSHKVYRCIPDTPAAHEAYQTLLQISTVFDDRPPDRPIDPVLQMKPFWNAGSNCFSWIDEPYLKPTNQQNELGDDEVLIGSVDMEVDTDTHCAPGGTMDEYL